MDDLIAEQFKNELNPGETIEWCGKPYQGFYIQNDELLAYPFLLLWGIIIIFLSSMLVKLGFFGIILMCLAILSFLCLVFSQSVFRFFQQKKTVYAITNHRIIIQSGIVNLNIKSIFLADLKEINLCVKKSGRGTIRFGASNILPVWNHQYGSYIVERTYYAPSFVLIDDVKRIYDLIKKLQYEKTNK